MDTITYRAANEADADALAAFFAETFTEIFGHLYSRENLATFLAQHGPARWQHQLRDETIAIRIAELRQAIAGLAKLGSVKLPVAPSGPALEIQQLYVAPAVRGQGVAVTLMQWMLEEAKARGAGEVFLSVYTDNIRAQRFYARYGFVDVGPCVFMVGDQADEDRIMQAPLP
jgi:ribosomal protein S18 acetylase RimI-like enzyme